MSHPNLNDLQSERDSKEEILKAFRLFDEDGKGRISFKDLKRVARELGEEMTDEEVCAGRLVQRLLLS